ncbi:hypothetical protein EU537_07010 [Candidatus Thorarchaeota archaeon]|nr:MAG: hypothetical protein EU537_07010 [Candidatus Thorarchaeota archaeon]
MPHAGLIPPNISEEEELLLRAKLHVRGARIRQERGENADAIAAFYDALVSALLRFFVSDTLRRVHGLPPLDDNGDEKEHLKILSEHNVIDAEFGLSELEELSSMLDRAFEGKTVGPLGNGLMEKYESIMKQLQVLPLRDDELPKELSITT